MKIPLRELDGGSAFLYGNELYVKSKRVDMHGNCLCVSLDTGYVREFKNTILVRSVVLNAALW